MANKKASETPEEMPPVEEKTDEPPLNVVEDAGPVRFLVRKFMSSRSTGVLVEPGTIVTRDGFLAGNSDDDIELYVKLGALRPLDAEGN